MQTGIPLDAEFSEEVYLEKNPDVEAAVCAGRYPSGWAHFCQIGYREKRLHKPSDRAVDTAATQLRQVDVLFLIEHVARELDVVCAIATLLQKHFGLTTEIKHIYYDINDVLRRSCPRLVVCPYFYRTGSMTEGPELFAPVSRWPSTFFFNLAWEEIFYEGHFKIKAPGDDFAKQSVIHHAWGQFYLDFLASHGVNQDLIFLNGNPAYQLYREPYRGYYADKSTLAARHQLHPQKRWIFIPENYRWAFVPDHVIDLREGQGADRKQMVEMRNFACDSLAMLISWCSRLARNDAVEVIVRPKPATSLFEFEHFIKAALGQSSPISFRIIKDETVREWILASDVVISSFSTTLIEAAIADKPIYMVEPLPITKAFAAPWYSMVEKITSPTEFVHSCEGPLNKNGSLLARWAEDNMLSLGDPIQRLSAFLANLVDEHRQVVTDVRPTVNNEIIQELPLRIYNALTHEKDIFSQEDINSRISQWRSLLTSRK